MCRRDSMQTRAVGVLQQISIGKYDRGLYLDEKRHHSSICGGILTILIVVTIIGYMTSVFTTIFQRLEYKIDESSLVFVSSGITNLTFGQISSQLPTSFELDINKNYGYTSCQDVGFALTVDEVTQEIPFTSENYMGSTSIRCSYNKLQDKPEY